MNAHKSYVDVFINRIVIKNCFLFPVGMAIEMTGEMWFQTWERAIASRTPRRVHASESNAQDFFYPNENFGYGESTMGVKTG